MDKTLLSDLMAYATIALFALAFITLALGLFNTAMMTFGFTLGSLGLHTITNTL